MGGQHRAQASWFWSNPAPVTAADGGMRQQMEDLLKTETRRHRFQGLRYKYDRACAFCLSPHLSNTHFLKFLITLESKKYLVLIWVSLSASCSSDGRHVLCILHTARPTRRGGSEPQVVTCFHANSNEPPRQKEHKLYWAQQQATPANKDSGILRTQALTCGPSQAGAAVTEKQTVPKLPSATQHIPGQVCKQPLMNESQIPNKLPVNCTPTKSQCMHTSPLPPPANI